MKLPGPFPVVDTHAHLDFKNFNKDREEVLHRAEKAGLEMIINIGFDLASSQKGIALAESSSLIYAAVGIHPHDAAGAPPGYLSRLEEMAAHSRVVALGEMGLDFYRDRSPRHVQEQVFREQLRLALKLNLPVVIHDRDAHNKVMAILEEEGLPPAGGVMHCFSGDLALARRALKLGLYLSFAGPVTYPRNEALRKVAAAVPEEKLLLETDAPFLVPRPLKGVRNEPSYVTFIAEEVARLRGKTAAVIGNICLLNTGTLFGIAYN